MTTEFSNDGGGTWKLQENGFPWENLEPYILPLSETEVETAIAAAIEQTGASTIRDMGAVMGALKSRYAGQMDFSKVGAAVKSALG